MKICDLSKIEMIELIEDSKSISDALKKLNVNSRGSGAYKTFRNHCERLEINLYEIKFKFIKMDNNQGVKRTLDEILVVDSTYQNISRLKIRLISENILKYRCVKCNNNGKWIGNKLILQLDHINGINNDHRIENLRFLCPNCHSQTKTFGGLNQKRSNKNN